MNQNFFLHGKLFKLKFKIFNTLQKDHFWTFPPCNFLPFVKIPVFGLSFGLFNTWPKIANMPVFGPFSPRNVLWVDTNLQKLQICVLTKIKRTSKIQSMSKNNLINSKKKEQAYFGTYKKYDCKICRKGKIYKRLLPSINL